MFWFGFGEPHLNRRLAVGLGQPLAEQLKQSGPLRCGHLSFWQKNDRTLEQLVNSSMFYQIGVMPLTSDGT